MAAGQNEYRRAGNAAGPPPEVLLAVHRAAARVQELAQANRELHFVTDPDRSGVVIQVRDLDGTVLGTLSPFAALEVMAGGELPAS